MEEVSAELVHRDGKTKQLSCDIGEKSLLSKLQELQKLSNDVLSELVLKERAGHIEAEDNDSVDEDDDSDSSANEAKEPDQKKPKRKENQLQVS